MEEISLKCSAWKTGRVLEFKWISDLIAWAQEQCSFWSLPPGVRVNSYQQIGQQLDEQIRQIAAIESQAQAYKGAADSNASRDPLQRLTSLFANIERGTLLISDSEGADVIKEAITTAPDIAGIVLLSYRSDAAERLNPIGLPTALLVQFVRFNNPTIYAETSKVDRGELARLKNFYEADIAKLREHTEGQIQASKNAEAAETKAISDRATQWEKTLEGRAAEWAKLKATYDTELGLRAPTTYWSSRARRSFWQAVAFSVIFLLCAGGLLWVFFDIGASYLKEIKTESPFISAIPVAIPILVGVWVLRVVARLFSENLKIQQDARERETLVKTFLALMRDETTGRAVVTDEDRKIILQALFRQSAVTSSDDSPPFSIFDFIKGIGR
ncbi:MAG: hypothetical protein JSR27_06965 [Proteobacteria bacterium]|nr:hypothetical protein [Pseudomonadota bacterium]